jgi:hypothetical protein
MEQEYDELLKQLHDYTQTALEHKEKGYERFYVHCGGLDGRLESFNTMEVLRFVSLIDGTIKDRKYPIGHTRAQAALAILGLDLKE